MDEMGNDLPILIGQAGPLNGQRWLISTTITIGREPTCEIVIPDRQVSRYHLRLSPDSKGMLLEDMASKNGTFCNGERVTTPIYIQDGANIQVALVQSFVYLSSDATMPMDPSGLLHASAGRLRMDARARRVWIAGSEVLPPLSAAQFRLLQTLYEHSGEVVPRQDLIAVTWEDEVSEGVSEQAFDALVRRLRDRLSSLDPTHDYIITVRGHGLRLDNPAE